MQSFIFIKDFDKYKKPNNDKAKSKSNREELKTLSKNNPITKNYLNEYIAVNKGKYIIDYSFYKSEKESKLSDYLFGLSFLIMFSCIFLLRSDIIIGILIYSVSNVVVYSKYFFKSFFSNKEEWAFKNIKGMSILYILFFIIGLAIFLLSYTANK